MSMKQHNPAQAAVLAGVLLMIFYVQSVMYRAYAAENLYRFAKKFYISRASPDGQTGLYGRALEYLQRAAGLCPRDSRYHFQIAEVLARQGSYQKAEESYIKAITAEPMRPDYRLALADIYIASGKNRLAEQELDRAVRLNPHGPAAYHRLARYYAFSAEPRDPDKARQEYKKAVALSDTDGQFYILEEIYSGVTRDYRELSGIMPMTSRAAYNLAYFLKDKHLPNEALAVFGASAALAESEDDDWVKANAYNWIGIIYLRQGRIDAAIENFQYARSAKPDYGWTFRNLGWACLQKEDLESSEEFYAESIRMEPKEPWAYYGLGMVYEKRGWVPEAIINYQRALRMGLGDAASEKTLADKLQRLKAV